MLDDFIGEAKGAVTGIKDLNQLLRFMDHENPPDQRATNRIFDVVVGDSLHYHEAFLRPRSDWTMDLVLGALQKEEKREQRALHDLIAPEPAVSGLFGRFWERRVHDVFRGYQGTPRTFTLRELGKANQIPWTFTIECSDYFSTTELFSKLQTTVAIGKTSYLQPHSGSYPTIDSMIYSQAPIAKGISSLVLLQMATNLHSLKVGGFKLIQRHLCRVLSLEELRPSKDSPWAVVFVVPEDRAETFTGIQKLIGDVKDVRIWQSKTRQFVLGLSPTDVYM